MWKWKAIEQRNSTVALDPLFTTFVKFDPCTYMGAMRVEIPFQKYNPSDDHEIFGRKVGRHFTIKNVRSLETITEEIHARLDIDAYGLVRFNAVESSKKRIRYPILTMESDWPEIDLATHRRIARWVARQIHRRFGCQVQVVYSGSKSFHVHFRINRKHVLPAEAVAIQKEITARAERWVRRKFDLSGFVWDSQVAGKLGLVRLGGGTRIQTGYARVNRHQDIVASHDSDFDDPTTAFPMDDGLKSAMSSSSVVRKARSRAGPRIPTTDADLRGYADFLKAVGSTVIPSHWGRYASGRRVIICYYSKRDFNPSCVLGLDSHFTTDSRGHQYQVGRSYQDYTQARDHDYRGNHSTLLRRMRKKFKRKLRLTLQKPRRKFIRILGGPYGVGKTTRALKMAKANTLPILLAFYTRELRNKTFRWAQHNLPNHRIVRLVSPMEAIEKRFPEFIAADFYRYLKGLGNEFFSKALGQYLPMAHPSIAIDIIRWHRIYRRLFDRELKRFYEGEYDAALMTQQGLVNRIIQRHGFRIPHHINVLMDEIEVGLWAEGEEDATRNSKAQQLLDAGGKWTILTGDSRPAVLGMPKPFRVKNVLTKQFITPIYFRTYMPLGVGGRGILHQNRALALPLLVAEERKRAKRDNIQLIVVGNVGKSAYRGLGIRTFESLKGDNRIFENKKSYRIVVLGTHPSPAEIESNSLVFGKKLVRGLPRNPGKTASLHKKRRYEHARNLVSADVTDKISQIIARIRGFRNRPDCEVVVYLWDNLPAIQKLSNFPYVWEPPSDPHPSIVGDLYNRGFDLKPEEISDIAHRIKRDGLFRAFIFSTLRIEGNSALEHNMEAVSAELWGTRKVLKFKSRYRGKPLTLVFKRMAC